MNKSWQKSNIKEDLASSENVIRLLIYYEHDNRNKAQQSLFVIRKQG